MASNVPPEFLAEWAKLTPDQQTRFMELMSTVERGSVTEEQEGGRLEYQSKSPFLTPENTSKVQIVNTRKDRDEKVKAVLELYASIKDKRLPRGVVLKEEMAAGAAAQRRTLIPEGLECTTTVLGKGNSSGEVVIVKDVKTGKEMALKTILISQFNKDEVLLWIHLADAELAPELYHFELKDNKIFFSMEVMTGKDLQDLIDDAMVSKMRVKDANLARCFSLCVLHELLGIQEHMRQANYAHGDIHGGNIRLGHAMDVKLFDFGLARKLLTPEDKRTLIKNDVVNLIRVFCLLYSGFDFQHSFEAASVLTARRLEEFNEFMIFISEEQRKEMYVIMYGLFDTVRDCRKEGYGDTTQMKSNVRSLIDADIDEIMKKAAVIIFPETFQQTRPDDVDSTFVPECAVEPISGANDDPIWVDVSLEAFATNVTEDRLRGMGLALGRHDL